MFNKAVETWRVSRWRAGRHTVRAANAGDRQRLLRSFGDEIRLLTPIAAKASGREWEIVPRLELATALGVIVGAWLNVEPHNPAWPGRDRLFLARRDDLITVGSALASVGYFAPERIAELVDAAYGSESGASIPGLEAAGEQADRVMAAAWESALESGRGKRRWRENFGVEAGMGWAEASWRASPAVWRTCMLADASDQGLDDFRELPVKEDERPAGLVAVIAAPRGEAAGLAEKWKRCEWETAVVGRSDCQTLYEVLNVPAGDRPLAVMLVVGQASGLSSRLAAQSRESRLLGELSDEQFNAIMDESLNF